MLSAGNLATTQAVVDAINRDMNEDADFTFANATYLADVADYVGRLSVTIQNKYAPAGEEAGFNARASFILGGQIKGEEPELYLVYPEGNHIRTSEQHPFFQIGETKYGKPILDRIIDADTPQELAMRCALVSMDSTMRSNVTVGPPIELLFYARDNYGGVNKYQRFEENNPYLRKLRRGWNEELVEAFIRLPSLEEVFGDEASQAGAS